MFNGNYQCIKKMIQFKLGNEMEHEERPKITWVKVTTNDMLIEKLIKSAYQSTK